MKRLAIVLLAVALAGCMGSTRPAPLIRQHVLEYAAPRVAGPDTVGEVLLVERFSASRHAAGLTMVYSPGSSLREVYPGHSWLAAPADLVSDFLRRDLRASGRFRAVLHPGDQDDPRYVLVGGVESFRETGTEAGRQALLEATATLLDISRKELPDRVLFQRSFRVEVKVEGPGADGLAEAMSRAMPQFSIQVIAAIDAALKRQGR